MSELTSIQRAAVDQARQLLAAAAEDDPREALAELVGAADPDYLYSAAFGSARVVIGSLLEIIDELTAS